jgi:hypothetical protein
MAAMLERQHLGNEVGFTEGLAAQENAFVAPVHRNSLA